MYKLGDFVTAKKTIYDDDNLISVMKDNRYKILNIKTYFETNTYYFFINDQYKTYTLSSNYFYTKQELRELKLNKLLDV